VSEMESVPHTHHNATDTASAYSQDTDISNDGALMATIDPILRSSTVNLDAWDRRDQATIVYIKKTDKPLVNYAVMCVMFSCVAIGSIHIQARRCSVCWSLVEGL